MKKILIATSNKAKSEEIIKGLRILTNQKIQLLTLSDVKVEEKPIESGNTFKKNSFIKARFYSKHTNLPAISDDGGLTIPYLNNQPGVKSRRWPTSLHKRNGLEYEASDKELINFCLQQLIGVKRADRTAYLTVCLCFYDPKTKKTIYEEEKIKGYIALKPSRKWIKGYPFRSLFIVEKFNKYYDELTAEENEKINHRLKAVKRFVPVILNLFQDLKNA